MVTETPESIGLDSKSPFERDQIDLNHEIAGVDVGRMQRFLLDNSLDPRNENSEKKKSERAMTMLRYLLENDAQYAKRYFEVAEKLDLAQQEVDGALSDITQRIAVSDRELQDLRDDAAKLEDGASVFKSSDGSIYTEGGQRLSDEDAQKIDIPDGAPSWEEYKAAQERHAVLLRDRQDIERYEREVLKPAQDRMQDRDNPPSSDELDQIEQDIDTKMPASVRKYSANAQVTAAPTLSVAQEMQGSPSLSVPDLDALFRNAANNDAASQGIQLPQPKLDVPELNF